MVSCFVLGSYLVDFVMLIQPSGNFSKRILSSLHTECLVNLIQNLEDSSLRHTIEIWPNVTISLYNWQQGSSVLQLFMVILLKFEEHNKVYGVADERTGVRWLTLHKNVSNYSSYNHSNAPDVLKKQGRICEILDLDGRNNVEFRLVIWDPRRRSSAEN